MLTCAFNGRKHWNRIILDVACIFMAYCTAYTKGYVRALKLNLQYITDPLTRNNHVNIKFRYYLCINGLKSSYSDPGV